jgi:hypothetical protein
MVEFKPLAYNIKLFGKSSMISQVLTTNINVLCYLILLDLTYFNNLIASFNNSSLLKNILEVCLIVISVMMIFNSLAKCTKIIVISVVANF